MARFFAVLSGSAPSALTSDFFDQLTISNGTSKRSGLIDSRSVLSTDIYNEVDSQNIDGSKGIYFPPNLITTDSSTFISGSIYTSSVAGIVIPSNYRTRPTGSILSTQTTLVGPTNPLDSASAIYSTYLNATNAVKNVLDSITGGGPYGRLGVNQSRTLHSLWHDENLAYFAWDDFTPGTVTFYTPQFGPTAGGVLYITSSTTGLSASVSWTGTYSADILGPVDLGLILEYSGSTNPPVAEKFVAFQNLSNLGYDWILDSDISGFNQGGENPKKLEFTGSAKFYDITITSHAGAPATQSFAQVIEAQRLMTISNNRLFVATASNDTTCYQVTTPLYSTFDGLFPGDNSAISTSQIKKIYSNIAPGPVAPTGYDPAGFLPNHNLGGQYWMVYASFNGLPGSSDEICEYADGIRTGTSCVAATPCFFTTTTTTTTTGACTSFSYADVTTASPNCCLSACSTAQSLTGYSNTGLNIGSRLYQSTSPCSSPFSAGFIQIDSTNYEIDSNGYIINTAPVTC